MTSKCPRCGSSHPHLHPAVQFEGEVEVCTHDFHLTSTNQNTPKIMAAVMAKRDAVREALMNVGIGLHVAKREAAEAVAERDRLAAELAARAQLADAKAAQAQCCMCGKSGLSTAEDGGPECELHDGRWVCSSACWEIASVLADTDGLALVQTLLAERREGGEWKGPGEAPHRYSPDPMAMGDCCICGHTREAHE